MSTLNALNTLIGIINSRKNKLNPTGPMPGAAASSDPNRTNPTLPTDPATSPVKEDEEGVQLFRQFSKDAGESVRSNVLTCRPAASGTTAQRAVQACLPSGRD